MLISMLKSANPQIQRLLGVTGKTGVHLKLDKKWAYRIIKQVGNYGQSFDEHVGKNSPLNIPRGLNKLWNKGGLMVPYAN